MVSFKKPRTRIRLRLILASFVAALISCSDPLGPLMDGKPYPLRTINGQALPWTSPPPGAWHITDGWVKIDNDSIAERHETLLTVTADPVTYFGPYTLTPRMLIIRYTSGGNPRPYNAVDTFYVSGNGLVMREVYTSPPDTMVRYYARP